MAGLEYEKPSAPPPPKIYASSMDVEYYRDLIRYQFAGRKIIMAGAPLAAFTSAIPTVKELGATELFILASGVGAGDLPSSDDARWAILDTRSDTMIGSFRKMERLLDDLPADVRRGLDDWDPEKEAVLLPSPFYYRNELAGRRVYGWRRPEWLALEDKTVADGLWDAAGVDRAPSRLVPVALDEVERAAAELDRGAGVVLSGDARDGFNGGAEYVRWVDSSAEMSEPIQFFSLHCDKLRVMPFLEGIPCSIHGLVFPEKTVALRPCELMTLRRPGKALKYCGAASYWDPPDADREDMRRIAERVGEHLRRRVDYRGAFTVDGVMTADGFLPTELNTRAGAGVGTLLSGLSRLSLGSLNRALIEREALDYRPDEFERLLVGAADEHRGGGGWTVVETEAESTAKTLLTSEKGHLRPTENDEDTAGSLSFGPGEQGGFVRFAPASNVTPTGDSLAPLVVDSFRVAHELWDVGLDDLAPAPSVR